MGDERGWQINITAHVHARSSLAPPLAAQQYISPEHARVSGGNNSQGPVYKVYVSFCGP
jgi:hypothetical protein